MNETSNPKYHCHITPKRNWLDLKLKEVWRYRDLIVLFTKRSFEVRYKQTILGPIWLFLNPLISSVLYAFVFGGIAGIGTDGTPHILFYLCSTAAWSFFASCLNKNASTFISNAGVFGKVYFPRLTIPISNVIFAAVEFLIQLLMVLLFMAYYLFRGEVSPNWAAWSLIPVILLHLGLLGMGVGVIISSLTTKYRDLSILVSFGVGLWMYITPVVYPISQLDRLPAAWMRRVVMLNPVTSPVELLRCAVLGKGTFAAGYYAASWIVTVFVTVFGIMIFNRVEKTFMDTV